MALVFTNVVPPAKVGRTWKTEGSFTGWTGTYATGGLTFDLSGKMGGGRLPKVVLLKGKKGYDYTYIPGSTAANGLIMIRWCGGSGAVMSEYTNSATLAAGGIDTDVITYSITSM